MIAHTYVQIACLKWSTFEVLLQRYPKDWHVWLYVKGMLHPLVKALKNRLGTDKQQQEKHEEAVQRYTKRMQMKKSKGFVQLKKKDTSKWRAFGKAVFMRCHLERNSSIETVLEYLKLFQMIGILWIIPVMCALGTKDNTFNYVLAVLTMIGFLTSYIDWHFPYWQPDTGVLVTSPPMIFRNWLRTWALQHFLMKFPFDIFFMWNPNLLVAMTIARFCRLLNFAAVITKVARFKEMRTLHFGSNREEYF